MFRRVQVASFSLSQRENVSWSLLLFPATDRHSNSKASVSEGIQKTIHAQGKNNRLARGEIQIQENSGVSASSKSMSYQCSLKYWCPISMRWLFIKIWLCIGIKISFKILYSHDHNFHFLPIPRQRPTWFPGKLEDTARQGTFLLFSRLTQPMKQPINYCQNWILSSRMPHCPDNSDSPATAL